jgi:hypothetical protein
MYSGTNDLRGRLSFYVPLLTLDLRIDLHFIFQYQGLTFGYQKTNGSNVLQTCLEFAMKHFADFLPGEGGYLLDLLYDVSVIYAVLCCLLLFARLLCDRHLFHLTIQVHYGGKICDKCPWTERFYCF